MEIRNKHGSKCLQNHSYLIFYIPNTQPYIENTKEALNANGEHLELINIYKNIRYSSSIELSTKYDLKHK